MSEPRGSQVGRFGGTWVLGPCGKNILRRRLSLPNPQETLRQALFPPDLVEQVAGIAVWSCQTCSRNIRMAIHITVSHSIYIPWNHLLILEII